MTYGYDFSWGHSRIRGEGFTSKQESNERMWAALDAFGYQPPKWWEFWRWGEPRPTPRHDNGVDADAH